MADLLGDGLGDFRISAASRLAEDLPAAFGGGPEYKAGTGVFLTCSARWSLNVDSAQRISCVGFSLRL